MEFDEDPECSVFWDRAKAYADVLIKLSGNSVT
jgi:hypothetical protein